jgi:hypothetical protein
VWKPADMPGVPRRLIEHSLIVALKLRPRDNTSAASLATDGMPSRRKSLKDQNGKPERGV